LDSLPLVIFLVLVAAAVVLRRRINDPARPLGRWYARTIQSWYDRHGRSWSSLGFKIFLFLTMLLWLVIYLNGPERERGGLRELFAPLMYPQGKPPAGDEEK
jgi:hypothetical protein